MDIHIRPVVAQDVEALVQLSLAAWAPIFTSFEQILGPAIYRLIWPEWQTSQRAAVEGICNANGKTTVLVAEMDRVALGFLAYDLNLEAMTAEVQLLAVHPHYQNQGIATELNHFALEQMKARGIRLAIVETGGDPSHAPARRSYEKAGYTGLPIVRYFKDLTE